MIERGRLDILYTAANIISNNNIPPYEINGRKTCLRFTNSSALHFMLFRDIRHYSKSDARDMKLMTSTPPRKNYRK